MLGAEEQARIDDEKKTQSDLQHKDEQAFSLMSEFPHLEYQISYNLLEAHQWNYQLVSNDLRV